MEDITIIVKAMDRCESLQNLLKSIFKIYPDIKIIIADDGEKSCKEKILNKFKGKEIEYYELEKDIGLSAGRNFLISKVKTKYFFLLDDDMEIDKKTDIKYALKKLEEENLDIIGGYCRNYKTINNSFDRILVFFEKIFRYELPTNYIGTLNMKQDVFYANYIVHQFPEYTISDIVLNAFIAKTESVIDIGGWDEKLKLQEHTEFFYRAKLNKLKVAFTNHFSVQHHPVRLKNYKKKRDRDYTSIFMDKYKIKKIVRTYDDKRGTIITEK